MSRVDLYIVDFMFKCDRGDAKVSPKVVCHNINYTRSYVGRRLRKELVPRGLVDDEGGGLYSLTEKGKLLAQREISAEELNVSSEE